MLFLFFLFGNNLIIPHSERVCAVRVIAESEIIQDFLTESEEDISASPLVDLKVDLNKMSKYLHVNFMSKKAIFNSQTLMILMSNLYSKQTLH